MKRKVFLITLVVVMLVTVFSGCNVEQTLRTGSSAPEVQHDRLSYIEGQIEKLKAKDISSVISFVETLSKMVGSDVLKNYTTSYDAATKTVYVSASNANLAFYLDDSGNILFASASGAPAVKTALNQGIAKICVGTGISSNVQNLFNSVAETQWLNTINSNIVQMQVSGFSMDTLDTTMRLDTSTMESLMQKEGFELTMPVLTTTLEEYGIEDLSNYYESPSLAKFWEGIDRNDINEEINTIMLNGQSIKEAYAGVKLEMPELEIDEWKLSEYSLPTKFSNGTVVGTTSSAFDKFRQETTDWMNENVQNEVLLQNQGWQAELNKGSTNMDTAKTEGENAMSIVELIGQQNQSSTAGKNNSSQINIDQAYKDAEEQMNLTGIGNRLDNELALIGKENELGSDVTVMENVQDIREEKWDKEDKDFNLLNSVSLAPMGPTPKINGGSYSTNYMDGYISIRNATIGSYGFILCRCDYDTKQLITSEMQYIQYANLNKTTTTMEETFTILLDQNYLTDGEVYKYAVYAKIYTSEGNEYTVTSTAWHEFTTENMI